jgi:malonate transporter and related proteins
LIFIGFAYGKAKGLPEAGLAWMNFFLLYVSLPALLFVIMSKTPFVELNNPSRSTAICSRRCIISNEWKDPTTAQRKNRRAAKSDYSLEGYLPHYRTEVAAISAPAPTQPILTVIPAAVR